MNSLSQLKQDVTIPRADERQQDVAQAAAAISIGLIALLYLVINAGLYIFKGWGLYWGSQLIASVPVLLFVVLIANWQVYNFPIVLVHETMVTKKQTHQVRSVAWLLSGLFGIVYPLYCFSSKLHDVLHHTSSSWWLTLLVSLGSWLIGFILVSGLRSGAAWGRVITGIVSLCGVVVGIIMYGNIQSDFLPVQWILNLHLQYAFLSVPSLLVALWTLWVLLRKWNPASSVE